MFTLDSLISTAQAYARAPIAFIPNKDVRTSLGEVVDAQAELTHVVAKAFTDIATSMSKEVASFDWTKFDFTKLYAVPAAK